MIVELPGSVIKLLCFGRLEDFRFKYCVCLFIKTGRIKMFETSKCVRVNKYMKTGENGCAVLLSIEGERLLSWKA